MSGDETLILVVSLIIAGFTWLRWLLLALQYSHPHRAPTATRIAWFAAPFAGALLLGILVRFASHDVRDSPLYITFYLALGAAATGWGVVGLDRLGLSLRDDVIERRNPSAALAWSGALVGLTLAYAGSNIGDGPGWWVVVFCSGLSVGGLLLAWILIDRLGHAGEHITVERDPASGARIAGWFIGTGAILGRAAAGDWTTAAAATRDFLHHGLWAFALTLLALVLETVVGRPTRPLSIMDPRGAGLGLAWAGLGLAYVQLAGRW